MKTRGFATLSLMLLFAAVNFAHSGVEHIKGTVEAISADSITLETARGNPTMVTVLLLPSTKLIEDGAEVSRKELKVGTRVVVNAKTDADKLDAVSVVLGKQPAHGNTGSPTPRRVPSYNAYQQPGNSSRLES